MSETRYLELNDDVGLAPSHIVDPDSGLEVENDGTHRPLPGEPEPLNNISLHVPVPTIVDGEIVNQAREVRLEPNEEFNELLEARILPGSRVVECKHDALAEVLLQTGHYHETDQPRSEQPRRPRPSAPNPVALPDPPSAETPGETTTPTTSNGEGA